MKSKKSTPKPEKRHGLHAVSRGLQTSLARLGVLGDLKGPKEVREWLILSLSDMGQELGKYVGRTLYKGTISIWECGIRPVPLEIISAYSELISGKLSAQLGRRVEISIEVNSPWRVSAYRQCDCGQFFKMHDAKSRRCPKCARRRSDGLSI